MLIGPNVAGHGHTYDDTYCEKAQDDTEQLLKQEEHGLRVRRGQIVFAQDSISSRTRSGAHIMWMCMSNQMKNENEVACEFEKSSLWHRRVIAGVQMKPNGEFVLPFAGVPPTSAENLAKAQMFKQHISGVDLINKFKESLWKGMHLARAKTSSTPAACQPFSRALSCLQLAPARSQEFVRERRAPLLKNLSPGFCASARISALWN